MKQTGNNKNKRSHVDNHQGPIVQSRAPAPWAAARRPPAVVHQRPSSPPAADREWTDKRAHGGAAQGAVTTDRAVVCGAGGAGLPIDTPRVGNHSRAQTQPPSAVPWVHPDAWGHTGTGPP